MRIEIKGAIKFQGKYKANGISFSKPDRTGQERNWMHTATRGISETAVHR